MATRLSNLKAAEVSIVPRGANKQEFLVVKEDVGMSTTALQKALTDAGLLGTLDEKVTKALEPVLKDLSEKGKEAVQSALQILMSVKDELPPELTKSLMAAAGVGNEPAPPPAAPVAKDPTADSVHVDRPIFKEGAWDYTGVSEAVALIHKENVEKDAKIATLEAAAAAAEDVRITKEFVEKAAEFKGLGVKTEDLGSVLKEVSQKAPDAFAKLEPILKALDEKIVKGGLYQELGTSTQGAPTPTAGQTEAEAAIEQIAKGLVEKAGDKKLTHEQAVAKAWSENPDLYTKHREESDRRKRA